MVSRPQRITGERAAREGVNRCKTVLSRRLGRWVVTLHEGGKEGVAAGRNLEVIYVEVTAKTNKADERGDHSSYGIQRLIFIFSMEQS